MANRFLSNIKINDAYTFPASDGTNGQVIKTDGSGNLSFAQLAADSASVMYKDTFTGNGSTTAFTLANALNDEVQSNVYIDGVYQSKSTYSVSGTTLTFSTAPASGHEIEVISTTGINSGPTAIYTDTFTANGSAAAFTLGQTVHDENQTIVFLNGVYQFKGTYALSGTTLTLDAAPANGVAIEVMSIGSAYSGGDILYDHDFGSAGLMTTNGSGVYSITANNSANWNTAYGWGDHSTQSYATQSYVGTQISNLVDSSPSALNTLNELAAALGDDANFSTTVTNSIATKLPLAGGTMTGDITASQSVFNITNNDIRFKTSGAETMLRAVANDAVELMYNNSTKIETTSTGVTVTAEAAVGNGTDGIKLSYSSGNSSGIIDTGFSSTALEFRVGNTQELLINGTSATFAGTVSATNVGVNGFITHNGDSGTFMGWSADDTNVFYTAGNERLRINADGDVLMGNTVVNPASGFASQKGFGYDASSGQTQIASTSDVATLVLGRNNATDGSLLEFRKQSTVIGNFGSNTTGGQVLLDLKANQNFRIVTNNVERMRINSSGNVGIGTASPNEKIQVAGNIHAYAPSGIDAGLFASTAAGSTTMAIRSSGITHFNGGNVGIGTTSPEAKLDVRAGSGGKIILGSYNANYKVVVEGGDQLNFYNGSSAATGYINYAGPGNILLSRNLFVEANSNGGTAGAVRIKSDGKVGIGINTPQTNLQVNGTVNTFLAHFGGQNNTDGQWNGISLGYAEGGNANYRKVGIAAKATGDGAARQELHFLVDSNADGNSASIADSKMMINKTGNVGIGTDSPGAKLQIGSATYAPNGNLSNNLLQIKSPSGFAYLTIGNSDVANSTSYIGGASGYLVFGSVTDAGALSEHIRMTNTGNVGIGVTSPSAKLDVFRTINVTSDNDTGYVNSALILNSTQSNARGAGVFMHNTNDDAEFYMGVPYAAGFDKWMVAFKSTTSHTDSTSEEANAKFIVESNGDVLIGGAAIQNERTVSFDVSTYGVVHDNCTTSGAGNGWEFQTFRRNNGNSSVQIGSIVMNGTSGITYATSSDYRLKENVVKLTNALDRIDQLKPSRFNFISDKGRTVDGFLAHEVQDIVPEAIVGTKDEVDEDDNPKYQSIDQSKIVPLLVAAIQELKADNDSLRARIETLENN